WARRGPAHLQEPDAPHCAAPRRGRAVAAAGHAGAEEGAGMSAIANIISALFAQAADTEQKALMLLVEYLETLERSPERDRPAPELLGQLRAVVDAHAYHLTQLNADDWYALVERLDALIGQR